MAINRTVSSVVIGAAIAAACAVTHAQTVATLNKVEGTIYINERLVVSQSTPIEVGEFASIRTVRGRAVVGISGELLALNEETSVRVLPDKVEVLSGTVIVVSGGGAPVISCQNDTRLSAGVFRFNVQPTSIGGKAVCRLRVFDGTATVRLLSITRELKMGQDIVLDPACGDLIPVTTFAHDQMDDFDRWTRLQTTGGPR